MTYRGRDEISAAVKDPMNELFVGDAHANQWQSREMLKPLSYGSI
jgi:hypothetical protein